MDTTSDLPGSRVRLGVHLMADASGAPSAPLDNLGLIRAAIETAVAALGATMLDLSWHQFEPQGITAVALLAESHLAIHTWPERGCFAADLFYCGACDAEPAIRALAATLGASECQVRRLDREVRATAELTTTLR